MNKTVLIGLAVGAVIVIAALGVFLLNSQKSQPAMTSDTQETMASDTDNQPRSLRELMSFANNQTCTFQDEQGNSGTVYVANSAMRGDFQAESAGTTTQTHMIIKDNNMYVWFDENNEGFMTSLDSVSQLQAEQGDDAPKSVDIDKQVDYTCAAWNTDASVFERPGDVTFTDYSAMMESAASMMEGSESNTQGNSAQCSACNSLPESAKAQCLQTLNCN